jgi:hypothetical protein
MMLTGHSVLLSLEALSAELQEVAHLMIVAIVRIVHRCLHRAGKPTAMELQMMPSHNVASSLAENRVLLASLIAAGVLGQPVAETGAGYCAG